MLLAKRKYLALKALLSIGLFTPCYDLPTSVKLDASNKPESYLKKMHSRHYEHVNMNNNTLSINTELFHMAAKRIFYSKYNIILNTFFCISVFAVFLYFAYLATINHEENIFILSMSTIVAAYLCSIIGQSRYNYFVYKEYKSFRRNPFYYLGNLSVSVNDFAIFRILGYSILVLVIAFAILTLLVVLLVMTSF